MTPPRASRFRGVLSAAVAVPLLLAPVRALGSPLLDTTGAIGGNAGEQGVVSGPSAASTYFNPANLALADDGVLVSYGFVSEQIGVTLDGREAGSDVPLVVGSRDVIAPDGTALPNDRVPTGWLESGCAPGGSAGAGPSGCPSPGLAARPRQRAGSSGKTRTFLTLGLVKHLVPARLSVGLYTMLPVSSFVTARSFYADEREALFSNSLHPEMYGDRLTALSFAAGLGLRISPTLSIGLSATLALANVATASTYVRDASNYDVLLLDTATTTQVALAPILGVRFTPSARWRFGAAAHAPQSFELVTTLDAKLPSGSESGTTRRNVYHAMPWRIAVGAETDVVRRGRYTMSVTASVKASFWSTYEDRQATRPSSYGDDLAWNDTLSGALGVRHVYRGARGLVDLTYSPSPVPPQVGRSSYVDNDRVGMTLGGDIKLPLGASFVRPGLRLGVARLVPRHQTKDAARIRDELPDGSLVDSSREPIPGAGGVQSNSPGFPGFASAGYLWTGMVTLEVPL